MLNCNYRYLLVVKQYPLESSPKFTNMYRYHLFTFPKKYKYLRQFLRNLSSYLWLLCEKFWKQIFIVTPAVSHQNGDSQSKDAPLSLLKPTFTTLIHALLSITNKQLFYWNACFCSAGWFIESYSLLLSCIEKVRS